MVLFLGGLQLMAMGLLGEYLARVYDEVKQRPLYVIRQVHGQSRIGPGPGPLPGGDAPAG